MAVIDIYGVPVAHELLGSGRAGDIIITPGGRFAMDVEGLRELGSALVERGHRVLLWDRPNCGGSGLSFDASSESILHADTLIGLSASLSLARPLLVGGSAGSRVTLLAASRHPDAISGAFVWWISGGALCLSSMSYLYYHGSFTAAWLGDMSDVAALPEWRTSIERRPENRELLLEQDRARFVETMVRWAEDFVPRPDMPLPGLSEADLRALNVPLMVVQNSAADMHHPRDVTEAVARLAPLSRSIEAPWPAQEWADRLREAKSSGRSPFHRWPMLAEPIAAFAASVFEDQSGDSPRR